MAAISGNDLDRAIAQAQAYLRAEQLPDGAWHGQAMQGADATSETLIAQRFLGVLESADAAKALTWLLKQQLPDGSFAAYEGATQGSVDETAISYAALLAAGLAPAAQPAAKAYSYLQTHGGATATTPYTQILLTVAGIHDPSALPDMPVAPLLLPGVERLIGSRFTPVFTVMSIILPPMIGVLKAPLKSAGWLQRRKLALAAHNAVRYLSAHQNPTGNLFGCLNTTVMLLVAYKLLGLPNSDTRVWRALDDLKLWRIEDDETLSYMLYNSKVWNTGLVLGIFRAGQVPSDDPALVRAAEFLLAEQSLVPLPRDWQNPGRDAPRTGGWAFGASNPLGTDNDSTGVALWGLAHLEPRTAHVESAIERGLSWLWGMQNSDGGWAAFTHGQRGKPAGPFSIGILDMPGDLLGSLRLLLRPPPQFSEPATEDVTGRVLQGLGRLGFRARDPRVAQAVEFAHAQLYVNGVWWGRWECNYLPGTSEVLAGLASVEAELKHPAIVKAIEWVKRHQNADGGFGETTDSYDNLALAGTGESSSYVTGIVANALIACGAARTAAVERAVQWCLDTQAADGSWPQGTYQFTMQWPWPFYRLTLTPTIYPLRALTSYRRALAA